MSRQLGKNSNVFRITFWRAPLSGRLRTPIGVHILRDREVSVNSFLHVYKYLYRMQIVIYWEREKTMHMFVQIVVCLKTRVQVRFVVENFPFPNNHIKLNLSCT